MAKYQISLIRKYCFYILIPATLCRTSFLEFQTGEIVRIKQNVEIQTGTDCVLVSLTTSKGSLYNNIHFKIPKSKFQTFIHLNYKVAKVTRKQLPPLIQWKFIRHCSLVLYYYLENKNAIVDPIQSWVTTFIPGGLLYSYHLLLFPSSCITSLQKSVQTLPLHFTTLTNLLILPISYKYDEKEQDAKNSPDEPNHYDLDPSGKLREWRGQRNFHDRSTFHGHPLIWSTFITNKAALATDKIMAYMKKEPRRGFPNLFLDTVASVSKYCNATPGVLADHYSTGKRNRRTKKWSGVIGSVTNGIAHVMLYSSLTKSYASAMIPTVAVLDGNSIVFFTGLPKSVAPPNPLSFLVKALDPVVLGFELAAMILIGLVIFGGYLLLMKRGSFGLDVLQELNSILFNMLRSLVEQDFSSNFRKMTQYAMGLNLFMIGPWLLILNILSSELRTQLVTSLTLPVMEQPPKTWLELATGSKYPIGVFGLDDTSAGVMFQSLLKANNSLVRNIKKNIVKNYTLFDAKSCLKSTQDATNNICMGSVNIGKLCAAQHFITRTGQSLIQISSEPLVALHAVLYYSKKMPFLQERFNRILSSFLETGLFKRLSNFGEYFNKGKGNAEERKNLTELYASEIQEIKPHRLNFIIIVAFGCGIAFLVALAEICFGSPKFAKVEMYGVD